MYSPEVSESAILYDTSELLWSNNNNRPHGIFNDKYPLHIIPHPRKKNTFTNRISYDAQRNSYYENGFIYRTYLKSWDIGALYCEKEYSRNRNKSLFVDHTSYNASLIIYKFDYSSYENLGISYLNLKLNCFTEINDYNWAISISTDKSNNDSNFVVSSVKWIKIKKTDKDISENLTYYVKNKKFFYIKVESEYWCMRLGRSVPETRTRWNLFKNIEKVFTFDVIVELSSLQTSNYLTKLFKNFKSTNSRIIEKGKSSRNIVNNNENKSILGGLFNNKYWFNILQSKEKKDVYTHRISYDINENAYYENDNYNVKYLKKWDRGTFTHNNIYYYHKFRQGHYVHSLDHEKLPAYLTWKFDYRIGNLCLSSLVLKLRLSDIEKIKWSIQLLPTRKNPNPEFKSIDLKKNFHDRRYVKSGFDYTINLTGIVEDEYGFILKAYLNEIKTNVDAVHGIYSHDGFCMDIKMELKPNMIFDLINDNVEAIDENLLLFNDKNTSDFIIKLELPKGKEKLFYTHTKILSSRSDYFHALLNSSMLESRNGCLKLNDISYRILEKLLLFIYTNNIENINEIEIDDWIDLLYASSKFLLPKLFQICELSIRNLINFDNVKNVEKAAHDCCSTQLLKFCEMFEVKIETHNKLASVIGSAVKAIF